MKIEKRVNLYAFEVEYIDHTVTPEERQAITDVLNAYDLFKAASPTVRAKALNN